jgi:hypothetical protein
MVRVSLVVEDLLGLLGDLAFGGSGSPRHLFKADIDQYPNNTSLDKKVYGLF